ncbi:MAG: hypothetical protein KDD67_07095 [Ignavibacteriae bacterium]|nr:hypothetical protein [Ignavibacteriota bacterium]MCB9215243.1 hypothetical protein [Ignavibacteria bacterium]
MKLYFLLFAILFLCSGSGAEAQLPSTEADILARLHDSLETIPTSLISMDRCGMFLGRGDDPFTLYQDSATLAREIEEKRFIGQCKDFSPPEIDFEHQTLVGFNLFVDCNGHTRLNVFRDTSSRTYLIHVTLIDGMCRGMTSRSYWLLLPKLQDGYSLNVVTARVEKER